MNGIDVSTWQRGIDISKVPCDFVIAKATQGNYYVSPDCDRVVQQCIRLGKKFGVYHYVTGDYKEIEHFIKSISGYIGKGIICLDWERIQNRKFGNTEYLEECIAKVIELTKVPPIVYASKSGFPWRSCAKYNCGTWVAQYGSNRATGYQISPWNEKSYSCVIRQYSSNGWLNGYHGALDLNKAYITPHQWDLYARPQKTQEVIKKSFDTLAMAIDTIKGKYGTGAKRRLMLADRYDAVQKEVNHIMCLAMDTQRGAYGNGAKRRRLLGDYYDIVQWVINHKMG